MRQKLLGAMLLVLMGGAWAGDEVLVRKVWLRESVPGQESASLQMNLTATKSAKLVEVSSPWAKAVEIQRLSPGRGKMQVRVVNSVQLPRNRALVFDEHRVALMMVGLKYPLKVGEHVPVSLTLEFPGKQMRVLETEAEVKPLELSYKHYGGQEVHDHQ